MYRLILAFLMSLIAATALCQTRQTRYFNNSYLQKETSEQKGKFSQTIIQNPDGSVTTEVKDIKNDEVISTQTYKGDEPVGKWKYKRRNIPEELDYSFDLIYSDKSCTDTIAGLRNYFENNDSLKYTAPRISGPDQTLFHFIGKNMYYPDEAREKGIEGRVYLAFTISLDGKIENIVVKKSANILLDKEAARVIRKLKFSSAAVVNGQPKSVCVIMPLTFKLE